MCCVLSQVPETLRQNTRYNQRYVHPGANFVMLNGMLMEVKNFELYSEWCGALPWFNDVWLPFVESFVPV
jgi:hypothetical protein